MFLTVSREVSFEYTKIAYRVPSVKRSARARHLMNSNVKEEKNCQGVKNRVELRYNDKQDNKKLRTTKFYPTIKVKIILRFEISDSDCPLMHRLRSARFTSDERD